MQKLPPISGKKVVKLLKKLGYKKVRQKGSHMRFKKDTHLGEHSITVPYHKEISKGTLNSILNSLSLWNNIPKKELIRMLKEDV